MVHVTNFPPFADKITAVIRVVTYNVLANSLVEKLMYPFTSEQMLSWDYRKKNLIKELKELDADIVCLQVLRFVFRALLIRVGS